MTNSSEPDAPKTAADQTDADLAPEERVPGEQGGQVPEQHGGVVHGSDAVDD